MSFSPIAAEQEQEQPPNKRFPGEWWVGSGSAADGGGQPASERESKGEFIVLR